MMDIQEGITTYFVEGSLNCARTSLKVLSGYFSLLLPEQVDHAALGMNGAGKYRAQCGLVEGPLMFLGILGAQKGKTPDQVNEACSGFAAAFEEQFGSLRCRELRPDGFVDGQDPNVCEPLARKTLPFTVKYIQELGW